MAVGLSGPSPFDDVDESPSKDLVLTLYRNCPDDKINRFYDLIFGKRPAEELYDLARDPAQMDNIANLPEYAASKRELRQVLEQWMVETEDPRATDDDDRWDNYPYFGITYGPDGDHSWPGDPKRLRIE